MENKYLIKFESEDYLNGNNLKSEERGNITMCENIVTFSHLEFDEEIKININSLVLCKKETFESDWEIYTFIDKNQGNPISIPYKKIDIKFSGCVFNKNVNLYPDDNIKIEFDGCKFNGDFRVKNKYSSENQKIKIKKISIQNSIFKKDFTVHKAEVKSIKIKNVNCESLAEFNEVIIQEKFDLKEITYKGFTLFDRCIFNTKAEFEYIIFEKFASFRGSEFKKGLSLDFTSCEKEINFFGIKGLENNESKENTSIETYRIIKYNFEKIGNKIEANKYHALELEQKMRELEKNKWNNKKDYLVFKFHELSSEYSTNWIRALVWILIVGFITMLLSQSYFHLIILLTIFLVGIKTKKLLLTQSLLIMYSILIILCTNLCFIEIFKYINIILKVENFEEDYFLMTFNKVSLSYLYYQFLISVRKDTRK